MPNVSDGKFNYASDELQVDGQDMTATSFSSDVVNVNSTTDPSISIRLTKVGKLVTGTVTAAISEASKAGTNNPTLSDNLPAAFRPNENAIRIPWVIADNGTTQGGYININLSGAIFFAKLTGTWTNAALMEIRAGSFSYVLP